MVLRTRRRLLAGTAALLAGLAGCSRSTRRNAPDDGPSRGENVEENPEHFVLRNAAEEPPVWLPRERDDATTAATTAGPPEYARTRSLVAAAETADRLRFADADGADEAREFASNTDFEIETLYVESRTVDECRSPELCYVSWSDTEVETQYGGHYRDADAACRADAKDAVTWLIRIPDALDSDAVRSYGSGWGSGGCRGRPRRRVTRTTTEAPDLGPATNDTATGDER